MSAVFRVLSGARSGYTLTTDEPFIRIGREEGLELRFDPHKDLEVSAHHATITLENDRWVLRDTHSTNGTFLNNVRVTDDVELKDGDRIAFGLKGPIIEVQLSEAARARAAAWVPDTTTQPAMVESATTRIRAEVAREKKRWTRWTGLLALVLVSVIVVLVVNGRRKERAWEAERVALLQRTDSAIVAGEAAIQSLKGEMQGLADALRASQQRVRSAGAELRSAERSGDAAKLPALRSEVSGALASLKHQQNAAALDRESIRQRNDRAVVKVFVEFADGKIASGTAFSVRSNATFITNKHLVASADGQPPTRLAVQFAYSDQVWPARVLATDSDNDLAIIKVDQITSSVPVVGAFNNRPDTMKAGAPVLLIGYPKGGEVSASDRVGRTNVKPVIGAGSVTSVGSKLIEVQGYGTSGSSGSPVFDAKGEIVAVVFGGSGAGKEHVLATVPASAAARLLKSL